MEEPPSKLDHIHLPRPDAGSSTPTFARWAIKEERASEDTKDVEMRYGEDEDFGDDRMHDQNMSMGFSSSSTTALERFAPLPDPAMIDTKHRRSQTVSDDKASRPLHLPQAGRARGLEPPAKAVALKDNIFADFKPWRGDGPEDVLNDNNIRNGYVDKPSTASSTETNLARSTLWPMLNNKGGLPLLSLLVVQVMDKRQALGKCTTPSTFKPPPRVTLTDTKREAWLRDLASTDVPLRRLSRTIPHGIRGKVLLEQCFSKNVPLARAIWLIKCVGANEIRAFRRKGISGPVAVAGEVKWIREWTICVEQFIASTAAACGQKDWKRQIRAVVRLAAALYTEDLLDHSHFLEWLIESFASSSIDILPFWLMMVGLFWPRITKVQRRGRAFCEALVSQLVALEEQSKHTSLDTLRSSLHQYLVRLISQHQSCVIAMKDWPQAKQILQHARDQAGDIRLQRCFDDILRRNDRLDPAQAELVAASKPARLSLFEYIDALPSETSTRACTDRCLEITGDHNLLVAALMDWTSSVHRTGHARTYLVVRLFRHLAEQGYALEDGILNALGDVEMQQSRDFTLFAKVVAELLTTQHFNYGKFLQWLISTGAAWQRNSHCMALLFAVPLEKLSSQSVSLRGAILQRLGVDSALPPAFGVLQLQLDEVITGQSSLDAELADDFLNRFLDLQPCFRQILCQRLAKGIGSLVNEALADKSSLDLNAGQFTFVRAFLEAASDFQTLSTVLANILQTSPPSLFTELVAAVEHNSDTFTSMESLTALLSQLLVAYPTARQTNNLDQVCIRSMISLCRGQTNMRSSAIKLENDLFAFEQQHAASVCSPASDSMLTVQNGQINADEDIDRMLASGNTMDEQMLARLFSAIVERTVKWTLNGPVSLSNPSRWFSLLRAFDNATFDRHMTLLISKLVANPGTDQVRALLISLVASGCLRLENTLSALEKRLDALESTPGPQLARFAIGALQTLLPSEDLERQGRQLEIYRFRIAQKLVCEQNRGAVLRFVWHALSAPAEASNLLFSKATVAWLMDCCITEPETFQSRLNVSSAQDMGHRGVQLLKMVNTMCVGVSAGKSDGGASMDLAGIVKVDLVFV